MATQTDKPARTIAGLSGGRLLFALFAFWVAIEVVLTWRTRGAMPAGLVAAAQVFLFATYIHARAVLGQLALPRAARFWAFWLLADIAATFIAIQTLGSLYRIARGFPLDYNLMANNRDEIVPTLTAIFGSTAAIIAVVIAVAWILIAWALKRQRPIHASAKPVVGLAIGLATLAVWIWSFPFPLLNAAFPNLVFVDLDTTSSRQGRFAADAIIPDFGSFHSSDGAPVFILQLESGNALALSGRAEPFPPGHPSYTPYTDQAAADGVYAPFMWGASIQTQRALSAILCSAVLDIGRGLTWRNPPPSTCLPNLLKADGYETVFQSSFWNGEFSNQGKFTQGVGFDDVAFGKMMKEDDPRRRWGYDDCHFYDRAFDYLEEHYAAGLHSKMLAMFQVSSHHVPYEANEDYRAYWPFPKAENFAQEYLNSYAMQDFCVSKFLQRAAAYRDRAHIIIVADHSFPVGILGSKYNEIGATSENFLVPFLYLPPKKDDGLYRRGVIENHVVGQPDIVPTLLELLSGTHYQNSFAFLLRQNSQTPRDRQDYEDCQVVAQPYDGTQIAVIKGNQKYTYQASNHQMLISTLTPEMLERPPLERVSPMTFEQFRNGYFCKRYAAAPN